MENLLETVDLDIEEANELTFRIKMEGAGTNPVKVRLVCEDKDVSYMFNGYGTGEDGVVQFMMPQMKNKMNEGVHPARVEVLIDNRYFSPVQFQINFKKTMQVVAESMFVAPKPPPRQEIKVTAQPITVRQVSRNELRSENEQEQKQVQKESFTAPKKINEKPQINRAIERDITRKSSIAAAVESDEKFSEIARSIRFKNPGR